MEYVRVVLATIGNGAASTGNADLLEVVLPVVEEQMIEWLKDEKRGCELRTTPQDLRVEGHDAPPTDVAVPRPSSAAFDSLNREPTD